MEDVGKLILLEPQPARVDQPEFDVILVQGRGREDARETWSTLWSEHWVSKEKRRKLRVLAFDYSDFVNDDYRLKTVYERAEKLLQDLINHRTDPSEEMRPIAFIGHSTGGVIVKQAGIALIIARDDPRFRNIAYSACAAIFCATPHRGHAEVIARIFKADSVNQALGIQAPLRMVPKEDIEPLDSISAEFLRISSGDIVLRNYVEGRPVEGRSEPLWVVPKPYASLYASWDKLWDLEAQLRSQDHFQACAFGVKPEDGPGWLISLLEDVKKESRKFKEKYFSEDRRRLLQSLGTRDVLLPTPPPPALLTGGTCEWIEDDKKFQPFQPWRKWASSKLWLTGGLCCGKTHLAQHIKTLILEDLKTDAQKNDLLIHFCLVSMKDGCVTPWRMLACLLHSILISYPILIHPLSGKLKEHRPSEYEEIEYLWREMIENITTGSQPRRLTVILDEIDQIIVNKSGLTDVLKVIMGEKHTRGARTKISSGNIRMIVLSRRGGIHSEALRECGFKEHQIPQRETKRDIKKTVTKELDTLGKLGRLDDREIPDLRQKIQTIAGDMYIIARLALREIARNPGAGDSLGNSIACFYDKILGRITRVPHTSQDSEAKRKNLLRGVLFWGAYQGHAMNKEELELGLAMLFKTGRALNEKSLELGLAWLLDVSGPEASDVSEGHVDKDLVERPEIETGYRNLKREILLKCMPLVTLRSDGRFELIHRSLKEYLSTPTRYFQPLPDIKNHQHYAFQDERADAVISSLCMDYLLLDAFNVERRDLRPREWEAEIEKRIDDHDFITYAAKHWIYHAKLSSKPFETNSAEHHSGSREYLLMDVETSLYALCWAEVWWYYTKLPERFPGTRFSVDKIFGRDKQLKRTPVDFNLRLELAKQLARTPEGVPPVLNELTPEPEEPTNGNSTPPPLDTPNPPYNRQVPPLAAPESATSHEPKTNDPQPAGSDPSRRGSEPITRPAVEGPVPINEYKSYHIREKSPTRKPTCCCTIL
ncbi:hypothetical protein B0T14DRAFT_465163 [Immersiella caudata]|uniref:Nephrocystin 3-like N-terminal domain-containing protein n=1 Tax=Immersiella caudata TaxID=314043 RepID=A0AA39TLI6_9PEZI|nr:hypothetical protein B0T14DRAFT_465163 [Immersiella caudata]